MSRHKTGYVISYHGILCHEMSYVTTIAASLALNSFTVFFVHKCFITCAGDLWAVKMLTNYICTKCDKNFKYIFYVTLGTEPFA